MRSKILILSLLCTVVPALISSCGTNPLDPVAGAKLPAVVGARSLSNHYVEVTFSQSTGPEAESPSRYSISWPDSRDLFVREAKLSADRMRVVLTTDPQGAVDYTIDIIGGSGAEQDPGGGTTSFHGNETPEPFLHSAVAISSTGVLLTFSEGVDPVRAENAAFYRITASDEQTPAHDVGDLEIVSAVMDSEFTVILTTDPQENLEYNVLVTNVTRDPQGGQPFLINPDRNNVDFFGIPPFDDVAPRLVKVEVTSHVTILLSFSEPLDNERSADLPMTDDARNFTITAPDREDISGLIVERAELTRHNTQILLHTLPQVSDVAYLVTVENVRDTADNVIDPNAATDTFVGIARLDSARPRVVGAASAGNTAVIVTFTKEMSDSAIVSGSYVIVQENVNPEVGALPVLGAEFLDGDASVVLLTTLSQNEVTYSVTVVNVKDREGQPLAPKELLVDPSTATFAGTPFSCPAGNQCQNGHGGQDGTGLCESDDDCTDDPPCSDGVEGSESGDDCAGACQLVTLECALPDMDNDGLSDFEELRGWIVRVTLASGDIIEREVTSDPLVPDTDGDGLDDQQEKRRATDPRDVDTDDDLIEDRDEVGIFFTSPTNQDTDGDGLNDSREITLFKSSPIHADTDGDGFDDRREVIDLNRNPRIADLPVPKINIGDMRLQIDERYTFTDAEGSSVSESSNTSTTLSQSRERTFSTSSTLAFKGMVEVGGGVEFGAKPPTFKIEGKVGFGVEHTSTTSRGSAEASQQAYERSLSKGREFTTTSVVTREIVGASIDTNITIENASDIAFTISNIEISVVQQGRDRSKLVPVATLLPAKTLQTGEEAVFNIGPDDEPRGPIIFSSRDVFPNLVEDLMRSPRGMIFRIANFDILDEFGRNLAFARQETNDRTAELAVDTGDGAVLKFRVATNGSFDDKLFLGGTCSDESSNPGEDCAADEDCPNGECQGAFIGGFDEFGTARGLPMDYVLQDILRLEKNRREPNAIVAGADGAVTTIAAGDDIQLIPPATTGLDDREVIILAGDNDVLDTTPNNGGPPLHDCCETGHGADCTDQDISDCVCGIDADCCNVEWSQDCIDLATSECNACTRDDRTAITVGYETSPTCNAQTFSRIAEPLFGGNGSVDTELGGDDEYDGGLQFGDPVDPGRTIILPGENGVIDSVQNGDDVFRGPSDICTNGITEPPRDGNGTADSVASGDDIQVVDLGEFVEPGQVIILPGPNGIVDSTSGGDDFDPGDYCPDAPNGSGAACDGREVLVRFLNSSTGNPNRFWLAFATGDIPVGTDFGAFLLKPQESIILAFGQDVDRDGLFAREEFVHGSNDRSKDSDRDQLGDFTEIRIGWNVRVLGQPTVQVFSDPRLDDSDGDGIRDDIESRCKTDPRKRDTDDDGVPDGEELGCGQCCIDADPQDETGTIQTVGACSERSDNPGAECTVDMDCTGPAGRCFKTRDLATIIKGDGTDFATTLEGRFIQPTSGNAVGEVRLVTRVISADELHIASPFGAELVSAFFRIRDCVETPRFCNDDDDCSNIGICCTEDGSDCDLERFCDSNGDCDADTRFDTCTIDRLGDVYDTCVDSCIDVCPPPELPPFPPVHLDPRNPDTDGDSLIDGIEFVLGADPLDPEDAERFLDSDQDGLTNDEENEGWTVEIEVCNNTHVNAHDGVCNTTDGSDCADCGGPATRVYDVQSDLLEGDSDFDGLPDLLEFILGTDPNKVDTDEDGLLDFDEFAEHAAFLSLNFEFPGFNLTDGGSQAIGTDPKLQDTDGDRLSDDFELLQGWPVLAFGDDQRRQVFSDPLFTDTDLDQASDLKEYLGTDNRPPGQDATDPTDPDTDGDGRTDGQEFVAGTNPLLPDIEVRVACTEIRVTDSPGGETEDWAWQLWVEKNGNFVSYLTTVDSCRIAGCGFGFNSCLEMQANRFGLIPPGGNTPRTIGMVEGDVIGLQGFITELDGSGCWRERRLVVDCFVEYERRFTFEELINGPGFQIEVLQESSGGCSAFFEISLRIE